MEELKLYIPKPEDLWFYRQMMSDPETMSYNAGWDVNYPGYHRDTGCIDCPDEALANWYDPWIGIVSMLISCAAPTAHGSVM